MAHANISAYQPGVTLTDEQLEGLVLAVQTLAWAGRSEHAVEAAIGYHPGHRCSWLAPGVPAPEAG